MPQVLTLLILLLPPQADPAEAQNWERMRSIAESQHEIVMLLIKNGKFDQVLAASQKIFQLNFPEDKESLFVRAGQTLADALIHQQQHGLAQQILDLVLGSVRSPLAKASLHKEKAYLCIKQGREDEAMRHFERALELEEALP